MEELVTLPINTRCTEWEITEAMIAYGGGFVSQLGRLIRLADTTNKRKLATAFVDYIKQYDEIAVLKGQQANG